MHSPLIRPSLTKKNAIIWFLQTLQGNINHEAMNL